MTPADLGGLADVRTALVVPVYDEAERVGDFVADIVAFVDQFSCGSRLYFVDDGSTDSTRADLDVILAFIGSDRVRVITRPHRGKGAAVSAGIRAAIADGAELVGFCDLDLSTPLDDLVRIMDAASTSDVLAIGSRDVLGSTVIRPESRTREALGRAYNRLMQAVATPGVVDTQCGAKAASARLWRRLLAYCDQDGFAWDAELVAVALGMNVPVVEVPVEWSHEARTRVRLWRDGLAMVRETRNVVRSADRAATRALVADDDGTYPEVFDEANAEAMSAVDRTHWWFRSKAAFVTTAVRAAGRDADRSGLLVDVGAGAGGVTSMLGWAPDRLVAVEGSPELASDARHERGLETIRATAGRLPIGSGTLSVVTMLDVIEHLDEPRDALHEVTRVLRPGGRLVVTVPAHPWLWSRADVLLGHRRRYTREALDHQLRDCGLEPLLLTHVFSWLVPPVWLVRRLAQRPDAAQLGLESRSRAVDVASLVLTAVERLAIGRVSMPFGTSLLCVARPEAAPGAARLRSP